MIKIITTVEEALASGVWSQLDDSQREALLQGFGEAYVTTFPEPLVLNFFFKEVDSNDDSQE